MKRALDAAFGAMIDARAKRILAETFLDWEHEAQRAATLQARIICHARASVSVLRAAAGIVVRDLVAIPGSAVWVRVALWLIATFLILYHQSFARSVPPGATALDQFTLAALLFPNWIVACAPLALFLSVLWRPRIEHRATPFLGIAILSLVVTFIAAGWVMPAASQEFREISYALHGGRGTLRRGAAELTLPELFAVAARLPVPSVEKQLSFRLVPVVSCPIMVLLASQMQWMRRRYRWVAAPVVLSAVGLAIWAASRSGVMHESVAIWGFPIAALIAAVSIGWIREGRPGLKSATGA